MNWSEPWFNGLTINHDQIEISPYILCVLYVSEFLLDWSLLSGGAGDHYESTVALVFCEGGEFKVLRNCMASRAFQTHIWVRKSGRSKSSLINKPHTFQCIGNIFCVEFQKVTWLNIENLRALRFKSLYVFLTPRTYGQGCMRLENWLIISNAPELPQFCTKS